MPAPADTNKKRRRWGRLLFFLAGAALLLWITVSWFHHASAANSSTISAAETTTVTRGDVEKSVQSAGKVIANLEVDIKCRASGEVQLLPFDISQHVRKGDLLCQLDSADEVLAVRSAQVAVSVAEARLAQAKFTLEQGRQNLDTSRERAQSTLASAKIKAANIELKTNRQQQLFEQKLGSKEDLETAETELATVRADQQAAEIAIEELKQQEIELQFKEQDVKMTEAQLESSKITLDTQNRQLGYTKVTSPINGTVSALSVQKGTMVASGTSGFSGGTTIMTLSDLSRVFMTATVDESDIGEVSVGQPARISIASYPGKIFTGAVVRKAIKGVNSSNVVTFEVKVEVLDDQKNLLQPEMTGSVTIIEAAKKDVLTASLMAVIKDKGKAFVTTADGKRKEVQLGLEGSEAVEITSGLTEGERLVMTTAELPTRWKSSQGGGPPR